MSTRKPVNEATIESKQKEAREVFDNHDSLLREAFHMEHFRSMLAYDPTEAKGDNSAVFKQYKSKHDLLADFNDSNAGPSSRTRRASSDQKSLNLLTESVAPVNPRRKGKVSSNAILDILATANRKTPDSNSKVNGKRRADIAEPSSPSRRSKGKKRLKSDAEREESNPYMDLASTIARAHSVPDGLDTPEPGLEPKRKPKGPRAPLIRLRVPKSQLATAPPKITLQRRQSSQLSAPAPAYHIPAKRKPEDEQLSTYEWSETPETRSFTTPEPDATIPTPSPIKRVKLIVRPPAPLLSNPLQRPAHPRHNYSLSKLLSSYVTDGDEEVSAEVLAERAHSQAQLLERAQKLRKEGHLLHDPSVLKLSPTEITNSQRKSVDIWDHCFNDVCNFLELKSEQQSGEDISQQISKAVQSYWEVQVVKQEKLRAQEERRMRALAKATIKMVTAEWKKAVFHLRNQERLRLEAEEVRRGHEHLDAILDQSGQILETQHGDLARADRSRSHSRGSSISDWTDEGDKEGGKEEEKEGSGESVGDDDANQDTKSQDEQEESATILDLLVDENSPEDRRESTSHEPPEPLPPDDMNHRSSSPATENPLKPATDDSTPSSNGQPLDGANSLRTNGVTPSLTLATDDTKVATVEVVDLTMLLDDDDDSVGQSLPSKINPRESPKAEAVPAVGPPSEGQSITDVDIHADSNIALLDSDESTEPATLSLSHPAEREEDDDDQDMERIPAYLRPYAVAYVDWDPNSKVAPPILLRGVLRPYQFTGLEWLASLHSNNLNGILADEMGLGKTIQTIALLAHLACDRGIWGPHLIIVPTSVLLNWEMEFKKFLPGFRILTYHGTTKRRKELRQGWNDKYHFNVCITSYTLATRDAHIFKRRNWYYMVLDEAHMIKNFKSQRWNILLMFRSFRRLLLTGTPLQNNLTELWALLQFLMSGSSFANLKEFGEWFSNPLEKAIEMGNVHNDETMQRVSKLHTVLRPYLLRRLKRDVEKELPSKFDHLVLCPLSKRQRFLYDEFMARANTREALRSGVYQKIANILMQLRKVCNHPDLFEVRPIVTSFAMDRSAIADYEIKELLIRRRLLNDDSSESPNLDLLGLSFINSQNTSQFATLGAARAAATSAAMIQLCEDPGPALPRDTRTIEGFRKYSDWQRRANTVARWSHTAYLNRLRYSRSSIYSSETISLVRSMYKPILPLCHIDVRTTNYVDSVVSSVNKAVLSYEERSNEMAGVIDRFAFITPSVVARDVAQFALAGLSPEVLNNTPLAFDEVVHRAAVKLSIAFPSPSLLQYDCGKLQRLTSLLREKKAGGHRVLLFTQMTRILDILEIYLNFHGYLYLRLDGATSIEDRQYVTERFNKDEKIFCFIASSRSGGVGINLTGADTVIFYDSDFNPQMDRQCEDRAHRIGQIRDVHIYRFVSEYTVEEAMLLKANQKRSLDDIVIQKGEFDWRSIFQFDQGSDETSASRLTKALGEFEDSEDAHAARIAEREEVDMEGADEADFGLGAVGEEKYISGSQVPEEVRQGNDDEDEEGGTTVEYMLAFINWDSEYFAQWKL